MLDRTRAVVTRLYLCCWARTRTDTVANELGIRDRRSPAYQAVAACLRQLEAERLVRNRGQGNWELLMQR